MLRSIVLLLCLALVSMPALALAAPEQGSPKPGSAKAIQLAKRHFERALEAYKSGAYRDAIVELEVALELDPEGKDLVYNLALVNEKLGRIDPAIEHFRRFQEMEDDPSEVARVEQIIQRLDGARREVDVDAPEGASSPEEPDEDEATEQDAGQPGTSTTTGERGRFDGWVLGAGGVAVAAIVVGTLFGVRALLTQPGSDDATGAGTNVYNLQDRADQAHGYAVIADVAFAIGIASGAVAGGLYFLREPAPTGQDAGQSARASGMGFSLGGRF